MFRLRAIRVVRKCYANSLLGYCVEQKLSSSCSSYLSPAADPVASPCRRRRVIAAVHSRHPYSACCSFAAPCAFWWTSPNPFPESTAGPATSATPRPRDSTALSSRRSHRTKPNPQTTAERTDDQLNMTKSCEFERLPSNVVPTHYNLHLEPDLVKCTFKGKATVDIQIKSETDRIVLNAVDLQITCSYVQLADLTQIKPTREPEFSADQETATFYFDAPLPVGDAKLFLVFNGELNDKLKGFYRSKYTTPNGEDRFAAVTQFEATDARRCFPCWDEPAIKAKFDVELLVPSHRVALSNMEVVHHEAQGDKQLYRFAQTPVMSTYLVAFVVGEFDYVEDKSSDGVQVRVYTPVGKKEQGRFALDVATKVLPYYKDYFDIAYPLPKMDLIAIADFSAGAMENWGLVTYRETYLLVDPDNTSLIRKQSIALTVGHEIAHQWFGNLVTMEWWTHLWLNEGYASFVEFLCVDHLFPGYNIWTQFVTDMYTQALQLDCLKNSHPIEVPVGHPSEIDEIFDEISYDKGASVIRMLHNFIGDEDFRKGMNIYLKRHQYKNTMTEDLWTALEEASSKPVAAVMSTWVKQMGFPVVTVSSVQQGKNRVLTITQDKFTADGQTSEEQYLWKVPINISTSVDPSKVAVSTLLETRTMEIVVENVSENDWIKLNPGTIGYYRTKYSGEMLQKFIPSVRDQTLPALDRLGLIDDLAALVQAGRTPTVEVLELIEAYRNETNYTVWMSITSCLVKLQALLSHTDLENEFNAYGIRLYKPIADRLGWDAKPNEDHFDTLLRSLVLSRLASCDCPEFLAKAQLRFNAHFTGETVLPADIRGACYKAVLKHGDITTYDQMLHLYRTSDLHEEKDRISRALGSMSDVELLRKVIDFAMSEEVRAQDAVFGIVAVAINPKGREMTWKFFKDNSAKLLAQYEGGFLLARLVKNLTENFATEAKAQEIEAYFRENTFPGTERAISQSIETIRLNAAWLTRDLDTITKYFKSNV